MRLPGRLSRAPVTLTGVLAALLLAAFALGPAEPAHADVTPKNVAKALQDDAVYVAKGLPETYPDDLERTVRTEMGQVKTRVFIAVLPGSQISSKPEAKSFTAALTDTVREDGTYLTVAAAGGEQSGYWVMSNVLPNKQLEQLTAQTWDTNQHENDLAGFLTDFLRQIDEAAADGGTAGSAASGGDAAQASVQGGGIPVGLIFLLVLVFGGVLFYGVNRHKRGRAQRDQLQRVRHVADEDVTRLGEDIALLDLDVRSGDLDDATRVDYKRAMDSYDNAKRRLEKAKRTEDLRLVSQALEDGRFQLACVRARLAGEQLPERRAPCFFNPQHGPSITDVDWAPPGGTARSIPVCRADADRLRHGQEPEKREVLVRGKRRPYWEAGPSYAPWFGGYYGGYYGAGGMMSGLLIGTMLGSALETEHIGHAGGFGGGDAGGGGGFGGGFDGGGGGFDGGGFGGFGGGFGGDGGGGGF